MKILIADDNRLTLKLVEAMAVKWGYETVAVSNGLEAWSVLNSETAPRLAILDWDMPGMSGTEICRRLRRVDREPYTFVILLTNNGNHDGIVTGLKSGADDFVRKPFNAAEMEQRVRTGARIIKLQDRLLATQESLRLQATQDPLLGIRNRREILRILGESIAQSCREGRPVGVMLIDVDFFKSVNDTFGHLAGDEVLRKVASVISAELRSYDHVGRYGGEEFLVVLPGADGNALQEIAERVRAQVDNSINEIEGEPWNISISIGIHGGVSTTVHEAEFVIQQCDTALYRAKQLGRNRVCTADILPDLIESR